MNCRIIITFLLLLFPSLSFAASVSDFSPIAHWTFDESSGIAYDSTSNAYDLTNNNSTGYVSAKLNNGIDIEDGSNNYMSILGTAFDMPDSSISLSWWEKKESCTGTSYSPIFAQVQGSTMSVEVTWYVAGSNCELGFTISNDGSSANRVQAYKQYSTASLNGVWKHYVLVFDNITDDIKLYIDGTVDTGFNETVVGSGVTTIWNNTVTVTIGTRIHNTGLNFDGVLDEMSVFDYALSSTDVTSLYNSGTPLPYSGSSPTATSTPLVVVYNDSDMYPIESIVTEGATYTVNYATSTNFPVSFDDVFLMFFLSILISALVAYIVYRML